MNLQQLFGIKFPIIQAPMAGVQDSALAIAVSNAGGLGSLPCAMLDADSLAEQLAQIKTQTQQPYNVNFFCHNLPQSDPHKESAWLGSLSPYYDELNIDLNDVHGGAIRHPFGEDALAVLEEFKPPVVSFHFGLPSEDLLARVKCWGAKVISTATTVDEGLWLEAQGVDAVIAQGFEAGGHRGNFLTDDLTTQVGTFALIPQMVAALNVPVIAAGGIADAKAVAAAMTLGAAGVQVGTSYLLCNEAKTSALHRAALLGSQHTALTNVFTGRPARSIVNRLVAEVGPMTTLAPMFPQAASALQPLRTKAEKNNSADFTPLWSGQNRTGMNAISAAEQTQALAEKVLL